MSLPHPLRACPQTFGRMPLPSKGGLEWFSSTSSDPPPLPGGSSPLHPLPFGVVQVALKGIDNHPDGECIYQILPFGLERTFPPLKVNVSPAERAPIAVAVSNKLERRLEEASEPAASAAGHHKSPERRRSGVSTIFSHFSHQSEVSTICSLKEIKTETGAHGLPTPHSRKAPSFRSHNSVAPHNSSFRTHHTPPSAAPPRRAPGCPATRRWAPPMSTRAAPSNAAVPWRSRPGCERGRGGPGRARNVIAVGLWLCWCWGGDRVAGLAGGI